MDAVGYCTLTSEDTTRGATATEQGSVARTVPIDLDRSTEKYTAAEKRAILEAASEVDCVFAQHAERMLENLQKREDL